MSPVLSPSPPEPPSAQSHDQASFHGNNMPAETKVEADNTTLVVTSVVGEKASGNVPMENHTAEMVGLSPEEKQELVKKWSQVLGPEYQVKVSQLLLPGGSPQNVAGGSICNQNQSRSD